MKTQEYNKKMIDYYENELKKNKIHIQDMKDKGLWNSKKEDARIVRTQLRHDERSIHDSLEWWYSEFNDEERRLKKKSEKKSQ